MGFWFTFGFVWFGGVYDKMVWGVGSNYARCIRIFLCTITTPLACIRTHYNLFIHQLTSPYLKNLSKINFSLKSWFQIISTQICRQQTYDASFNLFILIDFSTIFSNMQCIASYHWRLKFFTL